jgi:hypothetical protein
MPFESHPSTGLRRQIVSTALATITLLTAGIYMIVRAPAGNNAPAFVVEDQAARPRLVVTGSGSLTASGSFMAANGKTGSGYVIVGGSDGGGVCFADKDGAGFTIRDCNNGVCTDRVAAAAECLHP